MAKGRFQVRIIRSGLSLNGNFYPDAVLRQSTPLFEGVRVFSKSDREHLAGGGKDVRNLIGRITSPAFVPGDRADAGEIIGTLELIDPDSEIGRKVTMAADRDMLKLFGLSIDATGHARIGTFDNRPAQILSSLDEIRSVDLIVQPGAGGQVLNLIEAAGSSERQAQAMTRAELIALLQEKRPDLLKDKDITTIGDDALMELLKEALSQPTPSAVANVAEARDEMRRVINGSKLPQAAKQRLIESFSGRSFTAADVRKGILREAEYLRESGLSGGHVTGLGDASHFEVGDGPREKGAQMLDAFFNPKDRSVTSIRECYREITGDQKFTGLVQRRRLTEALDSTSFGEVLGDSVARRVVEEYNVADIYDLWRDLVTIVPVTDFRKQERTRFGGYGNLPAVAEKGAYQPLTSPTDEKAEYSISKRGGLETVTLEMIANDDVAAIQRIPQRLAQSAKRTLSKFVFDFLKTNPVIFDGKALFHVDHANLGTAALSSDAIAAGRLAMKAQAEKDSGEKIGIGPRFLWVPDELEETAYNLFKRTTNNDADFIESLQLQVRPVWCWTDANDWCLSAATRDVPVIELGFFNGQEEPELFIQDSPTSGSHFTNDQITYKIRHIYGSTVTDWRGLYKSVVAPA
ncbi:MAG: hypothetical protein E6Q98_18100 [Rhodospirillaceae bacterium]|nr:MAG: hypothetical protein E6Q98_18100 [Rhodospirillaceae bacterium]